MINFLLIVWVLASIVWVIHKVKSKSQKPERPRVQEDEPLPDGFNRHKSTPQDLIFERDALLCLLSRLQPVDAKAMNIAYAQSDFPRAQLLREIQIFSDSVDIALHSKNPETAESRMQGAEESYQRACGFNTLMTPSLATQLNSRYAQLRQNYPTAWRINAALGTIEKAINLKTDAGRKRRLDAALAYLTPAPGAVSQEQERVLAECRFAINDFSAPSECIQTLQAVSTSLSRSSPENQG